MERKVLRKVAFQMSTAIAPKCGRVRCCSILRFFDTCERLFILTEKLLWYLLDLRFKKWKGIKHVFRHPWLCGWALGFLTYLMFDERNFFAFHLAFCGKRKKLEEIWSKLRKTPTCQKCSAAFRSLLNWSGTLSILDLKLTHLLFLMSILKQLVRWSCAYLQFPLPLTLFRSISCNGMEAY